MCTIQEERSRRIAAWVRYGFTSASCRATRKCAEVAGDTPEGAYCLPHYIELPSCWQCGRAASHVSDMGQAICVECGDGLDELTLVSSPLASHDEVSGHDTLSATKGDLRRGLTKKMKAMGMKDTSDWEQGRVNQRKRTRVSA